MVNNFASLFKEVILKNKCVFCGACIASCPVEAIEVVKNKPMLKGVCYNCEVCYYQCARTGIYDKQFIEEKKFGRRRERDEVFGVYLKVFKAKATDKNILNVCQNGGAVTSLLKYMFDEGLIDAAVGVKRDENWEAYPFVVLNEKDLLEVAGSKYMVVPTLTAVREAVDYLFKKSIAVVGLPCQIEAVTNYKYSLKHPLKLGNKIKLTIGVFCFHEFKHAEMLNFFKEKNIELKEVTKMDIEKGRFKVYKGDELILNIKISELDPFTREACKICKDFTAELADISVGNVDSPSDWSTIIIRSEYGLKIFEDAVNKGYLTAEPLEKLETVKLLSKVKRKNALKHLKETAEVKARK